MNLAFKNIVQRLGALTLEVNLTLRGKTTALFGCSGSGKTSLLELVAGLRRPDHGEILLNDTTLADAYTFIPARRREIGYVPQDLALFPHLTVEQNITYGAKRAVPSQTGISREKLCAVLEIERLLSRKPASLSGGEKQRVAFARALLASPRMLLLDEPMASLDQSLKDRIMPCLKRIRDEFSIPMLYVTHSASEVVDLCEEVVVLDQGRCVAQGHVDEIFQPTEAQTYLPRIN